MESLTSDQSFARTLLQDHNQRLEQHMNNFETLQKEYLRLQQMYDKAREEEAVSSKNYTQLVVKSEEIIRQLQQERDDKITECEHLQRRVMDPHKMAKLQQTITEELEETYRKRIEELEMEVEVRNDEIVQLKRAYDFMKLEYTSLKSSTDLRSREIAKEHHSQLSLLRDKVREYSLKLERDIPSEIQRVRTLQRQNNTLEEQVKELLEENKSLKLKLTDAQTNKIQEVSVLKQKSVEYEGIVEQLSSDKLSLTAHLKRIERDHEETQRESVRLTDELTKLQNDLLMSQRKCDEVIHQQEKMKDELLLNNLKEVQSVQNEKVKYMKEVDQYKAQTENLSLIIQQLESALNDKTREVMLIKDKVRQDELERAVQAEKERGDSEQQLTNTQSAFLLKTQEFEVKLSNLQDQLMTTEAEKVSLEGECEVLRKELAEKNITLSKNDKELSELKELRQLKQSLTQEKEKVENELSEVETQLKEEREKCQILHHQLSHQQTEAKLIIDSNQKELQKLTSELTDVRISWEESKKELTQKCKEFEEKLKSNKKKKEKFKRENESLSSEIKKLLDTVSTNERNFTNEKEQLRKTAEEEKRLLKKQLLSFQRQQRQFHHLLVSTPHPTADITNGKLGLSTGGVGDLALFTDSCNLSQ
ncbi:PREDICTED: centrosomal protein of 83 kDa-like [Amphimedon queenslandica]|uniref:Uncharacterized protein n=1 Tax=Amphimedon queenslandica TaxID=400682 RepID=A0A1X7UAH4_AMPQE|nr:PREDICTED: centrosomal protein of 83 kDa-like [Amphimedon queenslandica]|eukprot:XP_011405701.2 PREDICTED: centrosomal protein of 83 kDa-like [Amphimedon queenslandica]